MESSSVLELACQIGYELYGDIGKKAFEELELAFASKLSPRFNPSLKLRSFTNLNFYWARGYFKNSIMESFQECMPNSFMNRKITGATVETMFGSINRNGDKVIPPLFHGYETCFIPELMTFLGDEMKKKVSTFNEALEGKETTRDILKFGEAQPSLVEQYQNGKEGLYFDGRTLRYTPSTSFVVGTHPLENEVYTFLEQSGFFSRFHTIQFIVTDTTARDIFTGALVPQKADVDRLKGQLKAGNEDLFSKREHLKNEPPDYEKLLLPIFQRTYEVAERLCDKKKTLLLPETLNPRIKGDIVREVNAYRILKPESDDEDVLKWTMARLPHFFDFVASPIIAPNLTQKLVPRIEDCERSVMTMTKGQSKKREEIVESLQKECYSRPMIDRVLENVKKKGLNKSTQYGTYET